jgi:hypothetical protein
MSNQNKLGVAGNSSELSLRGRLLRDLVAWEEYDIFNNLELAEDACGLGRTLPMAG